MVSVRKKDTKFTYRLVNYGNERLQHLRHIKLDIWNPAKTKINHRERAKKRPVE